MSAAADEMEDDVRVEPELGEVEVDESVLSPSSDSSDESSASE
jgi:hypothetical protein